MTVGKIKGSFRYIFLGLASFISIFPFYWMIVSTTNKASDVTAGKMSFGGELLNNFNILTETIDLPLVLWNSAKIALLTVVVQLIITSLAGYGYEMFRNKITEKIFLIVLLTMMVPFAALMIPLFRMFAQLGLVNRHIAVILPTLAWPLMIFFFRQNAKTFPKELREAARVDGLNEIQIFTRIFMPTMKSTYAAAAILSFMTAWNNFLWPLIILQSDEQMTIILKISSMSSAYYPEFGAIMVAIVIATLPTLLIFFLLQKHFVAGMLGSIK